MNRWQVAGESFGLYVEFRKDGEFMPPDAGSIKLTIRNFNGVPFTGYNRAQQTDVTTTSTLYTIPQLVTTINEGFESRFVQVDFTVGGVPCVWKDTFRVSPFLPITALPADVRNLYGVRNLELTDDAIDVYEGYYTLVNEVPGIAAALLATDQTAMYANRAIAIRTALLLIPSMQTRTMKQDGLNNATQIRQTIDWVTIEAKLRQELLGALNGVTPPEDTLGLDAFFFVVAPTDPVTNA